MPAAPLRPELRDFLAKPHPAVVGTVRPDGRPVTTPCWYKLREDDRVMLSMTDDSHRIRHLRNDPRVSLTVLADNWYHQLSLLGRAVEFRDDPDLADIDALAQHYEGEPYDDRDYRGVTVLLEIERWYTWGHPAGQGA